MRKLFPILLILTLLTSCMSVDDHFSDINNRYETNSLELSEDWKLIHFAAAYGNKKEMEAVLEIEGNINISDSLGNTPAIIAILNNNFESFNVLVERGCNLSIENKIGGNAISYIGYFDSENMKKAFSLLSGKDEFLNYSSSDGMTLSHYASYGLNTDMMSLIIESGFPINERENLTDLTPIDMTQLVNYKFTDLYKITDDEYLQEKKYIDFLLSNGSSDFSELPMSLAIYGNFLFVIYASIDSLFPYQVDIGYINRSEYFTVETINDQEYISLNEREIVQMFNNFYYDIEIEVVEKDFSKKIKECADSVYPYILIANYGNHPYMTQHWTTIRNINESGSYKNYLDVMNPNKLFKGQYFRTQDISQLVTIKLTEIKEET